MNLESNKEFFITAEKQANDKFMSVNGGNYDFENFDDELINFDAEYPKSNDELTCADGTPVSNLTSSQPYVLSIENISGGNVSNVVVLGAWKNLPSAGVFPWNFGNPFSISITMGVSSVTYPQFLFQTLTNGFTVGTLYLYSSNASQILSTATLQHQDSNGNLTEKVLTPVVDPYQNQSNVLAMKESFSVDGDTMMTISTMLASTTLKIYLYPSDVINPRNILGGKDYVVEAVDPQIIQPTPLNISVKQLNYLKK